MALLVKPSKQESSTDLSPNDTKEDVPSCTLEIEDPDLNSSKKLGPAFGPSLLSQNSDDRGNDEPSLPLSPFSSNRAAIRTLIMPPVPNLSIPPSPPGSPPVASTKKFAKFLELKTQGMHFNAKLDGSAAIRNPAILPKLLEYAGIDHYDQYSSALPENLSMPTSYPPWAYGEELNKTQQKLLKQREGSKAKDGRTRIEFVSQAPRDGNANAREGGSHKRQRRS
jgi:hypothetical protein